MKKTTQSYASPTLTRFEQLINKFKKSKFDYPDIHDIDNPSYQVLWVLRALKQDFNVEWTTALDLADILLALNISADEESVRNALAPLKGKKYHRKPSELGVALYGIMDKGLKHLDELEGKSIVYVIGGKNPRKDKMFLAEIIKSSKSGIKIIDPFFGSKTLINLEKFDSGKSIKLLTARISLEKKQTRKGFLNDLSDFKKYHKNFKCRIVPNQPSELHDRYILTKKSIILVGHGIKDLGDKESFILTFEKKMAVDIIIDLDNKFEQRWKNSKPIT